MMYRIKWFFSYETHPLAAGMLEALFVLFLWAGIYGIGSALHGYGLRHFDYVMADMKMAESPIAIAGQILVVVAGGFAIGYLGNRTMQRHRGDWLSLSPDTRLVCAYLPAAFAMVALTICGSVVHPGFMTWAPVVVAFAAAISERFAHKNPLRKARRHREKNLDAHRRLHNMPVLGSDQRE